MHASKLYLIKTVRGDTLMRFVQNLPVTAPTHNSTKVFETNKKLSINVLAVCQNWFGCAVLLKSSLDE